jgi:hypothetical protein
MFKLLENNAIIIGPVRLSYLSCYRPFKSRLTGKETYRVTALMPKGDSKPFAMPKDDIDKLQKHINSVRKGAFGDTKGVKLCMKDGDRLDDDGEPLSEGNWVLSLESKFKPRIIDGNRNEVPETDGWTSGDWGNVMLSFWTYNNAEGRGISANFLAVQFTHKDEPLGGSTKVDTSEFPEVPVSGGEYDPFADE